MFNMFKSVAAEASTRSPSLMTFTVVWKKKYNLTYYSSHQTNPSKTLKCNISANLKFQHATLWRFRRTKVYHLIIDNAKIGTNWKELTIISIVPFEILVGMERAWKKDVFSGPRPVFMGSMSTGQGAKAPARAGALTRFSTSLSRISTKSCLVKTKPTFPLMWGSSLNKQEIE